MKKIYEFTIWKEESKDDKKTYTPHRFFLRRPTRALADEAELFYSLELNKAIKLGLLTKAQLATKFADEVGTFSQKDKERYAAAYTELMGLETEFQTKSLKKYDERTDEEKKEIEKIAGKILDLRDELQTIESTQQSLFDHTAETRARNKLILWWAFYLVYNEDGKPFFGKGTFEECLKQYDIYDEMEDTFLLSVARKVLYLVSFWYAGRADNPKDFDIVAKSIGINIDPNEVNKDKVEEVKQTVESPPLDAAVKT